VYYFNVLDPRPHLYGLTIDATGSGTITLYQGSSDLRVSDETIGQFGRGTFTQTGGTHAINNLWVGGYSSTYNLSGTGVLSVYSYEVLSGLGTLFTQTGGTHMVPYILWVGHRGTGTYNLSDGSLSAGEECIGVWGGRGTFTQTGGTNTVGDWFGVGAYGTGTGTYNLSAGSLSASRQYIGADRGTGTFTQTGGTNTTNLLNVGGTWGNTGTGIYNLGDGSLSGHEESIGDGGTGTFTQTGGTNTTETLTIKARPTGTGVYNLDGGTLNATTGIVNNDRFNYSGGTLNGKFTNNVGATFTLSGAGTRTVNGDLTNSGTVKVTGSTYGTKAVFTGNVVNYGVLNTDPATLEFFGDLTVGTGGSIQASAGDQYVLHKNFLINASTAGWTTSEADLIFTGTGSHLFSFGSSNLTWNGLSLKDDVTLNFLGDTGSFHAAFLSGLVFNANRTIITNVLASGGFTLFYDPSQNPGLLSGIYQLSGGGTLSPVPLPGGVWLGLLGLIVAARRLKASGEWLSGRTLD
jgi:hypothetical protein